MKSTPSFILRFFVTLLCATASSYAGVVIGEPAPDFTLEDITSTTHRLSQYNGKYVVLEWTNPNCPFVKKHYENGDMQRLQETFTDQGGVWLSINSGAHGREDYDITEEPSTGSAITLLDSNGEVGRRYDARTTPHMFLIDPQGTLIYQGAIDSIHSTNPSDVPKATNYVVKAFEEALNGQEVSEPQTRPYGCSVKYAHK